MYCAISYIVLSYKMHETSYLKFSQDGCSIISNEKFLQMVDDHFVHA